MEVSVLICLTPDVIVYRPPQDVVVVAPPSGAGGIVPSERTISFTSDDFGIRQTDDLGTILVDASGGPLTGAKAMVFDETALRSPMKVLFQKVGTDQNEADIVDSNGDLVVSLTLPGQAPIWVALSGGIVRAMV